MRLICKLDDSFETDMNSNTGEPQLGELQSASFIYLFYISITVIIFHNITITGELHTCQLKDPVKS